MIRAFGWGVALAFVTTMVVVMAGFFWGLRISLPGIVELDSGTEDTPRAELELNPWAALLLAVVLAAVVWFIARMTSRRT
jgi:hypothetical protein